MNFYLIISLLSLLWGLLLLKLSFYCCLLFVFHAVLSGLKNDLYHNKLYQIDMADFSETGVIAYARKKEFSFLFIF